MVGRRRLLCLSVCRIDCCCVGLPIRGTSSPIVRRGPRGSWITGRIVCMYVCMLVANISCFVCRGTHSLTAWHRRVQCVIASVAHERTYSACTCPTPSIAEVPCAVILRNCGRAIGLTQLGQRHITRVRVAVGCSPFDHAPPCSIPIQTTHPHPPPLNSTAATADNKEHTVYQRYALKEASLPSRKQTPHLIYPLLIRCSSPPS